MNLELRRLGMQLEERRRDIEKRAAAAAAMEKIAADREAAACAAEAALESARKEAEARLDADRLMWCVDSLDSSCCVVPDLSATDLSLSIYCMGAMDTRVRSRCAR